MINPDGAINQLEGGIIQAASWALKEQVRLDDGTASVLARLGDAIRSCNSARCRRSPSSWSTRADNPPLGVGEATGGPTVAAIGNAVAHALGARIRDLPLTRERVMAALLTT